MFRDVEECQMIKMFQVTVSIPIILYDTVFTFDKKTGVSYSVKRQLFHQLASLFFVTCMGEQIFLVVPVVLK